MWQRYDEDRHRYVKGMFAAIAARYDLLNSVLSLRMHHRWRRVAARLTAVEPGDCALDLCAGTGDLSIELARHTGPNGHVFAVDFCEPMLQIGREKARPEGTARVHWLLGDAHSLPFTDACFDAVTIAFGMRNLIDKPRALREAWRVLKPGGRFVCLELNRPRHPLMRPFYDFYSLRLLPRIGKLLSQEDAYLYLPNSIQSYIERDTLLGLMSEAGFERTRYQDLSLGVVCIHTGVKSCLS